MAKVDKLESTWIKSLETFLYRNPDLRMIDDPEKLEYYRNDLNVDLPPLIRDLMLKSLPDLILQPTTEKHLLETFAFAREHKIPLTVRGAGTWGYGGAVPTRGGILIDLGSMDTIEVNPEAHRLTVGPGARFLDIHRGLDNQDLKSEDPEINNFLSTEGQMGIIVKATLKVGKRPSQWFPFLLPFENPSDAYAFAQQLARHPSIKPNDLIIYHTELACILKSQSNGRMFVEPKNLVLTVFSNDEQAHRFKTYLDEHKIKTADDASANYLWEERFLPEVIDRKSTRLNSSHGYT